MSITHTWGPSYDDDDDEDEDDCRDGDADDDDGVVRFGDDPSSPS